MNGESENRQYQIWPPFCHQYQHIKIWKALVEQFMSKCTDTTGNTIFQSFKNHNSWTVKVKIVIIELDLYFVISNNILKFWEALVEQFMRKCMDTTGNSIFQSFKNHNFWTVKVKIIIIELDLYFVISNNISKFGKLWWNSS